MQRSFHHLIVHVRTYGRQHRSLYALSVMILFWAMFDLVTTYITPLVLTEHGLSNTMMGIIIGSSSIFGGLFDLVMTRIARRATFRRLFLVMFAVCLAYSFVLWQANSIWLFLLAMALWGIYYDLANFGMFDFVGRYQKKSEHTSSFGVLEVFRALGSSLAPVFVGLTIVTVVTWQSFALSWVFLAISVLFFILLISITRGRTPIVPAEPTRRTARSRVSFALLRRMSRAMLPVLLATFILFCIDGFYWTIGPLFAEEMFAGSPFAGLFLAAFTIPPLFAGWFVGTITKRFHKKRTAFTSLLLGSGLIALFTLIPAPMLTIPLNFLAGVCLSLAFPALNGAYADYIAERPTVEEDIIALEDLAMNAGYVIGPMIAGVLADGVGFTNAFTVLGIFGAAVALLLLWKSPKSITVPASDA